MKEQFEIFSTVPLLKFLLKAITSYHLQKWGIYRASRNEVYTKSNLTWNFEKLNFWFRHYFHELPRILAFHIKGKSPEMHRQI